ncbi:MAG: response regulator [Saprospiraceae bacterium]|nr:response regulator [Saprospiraceae bacterium]
MISQDTPKILILESQLIIAADIALQFTKLGYEVMGFHSRSEELFSAITGNRPDIVLMNIDLKRKGDRFLTASKIWESFKVPVVLISSHSDRHTFNQIIQAQPYAFISKPFKIIDLQRGIETSLKRINTERLLKKSICA